LFVVRKITKKNPFHKETSYFFHHEAAISPKHLARQGAITLPPNGKGCRRLVASTWP
jgi:hypothetical protein